MTSTSHSAEPLEMLIIGAGFAGIGLAVQLRRAGHRSFMVVERASGVGGTWRDNVYPGAACDIQSHLYSYAFRPNPDWSRVYATQPEILDYLKDTAAAEGLDQHLALESELLALRWDEDTHLWTAETTRGTFRSRFVVAASGHLADPKLPDLPGLDMFEGKVFHSARWDAEWQPAGLRIGIVGSGASAIQIVPALAGVASGLTVFQRSAPYVVPRVDRVYSPTERETFRRIPGRMAELRDDLFWGNEARFPQRRGARDFLARIQRSAQSHLESQVPPGPLRDALSPDYVIGCKRILISNDYYPALQRPDVELVPAAVVRADKGGVVTATGRRHELDALVFCTGFEATDLPIAHRVFGPDGALAESWARGSRAYRCTAAPGFPNLFFINGPNVGLGAGSIIYMIESQIRYLVGMFEHCHRHATTRIEALPDAEQEFVDDLEERAAGTVWMSDGCTSWYRDPRSDRLTALWPDFMWRFRRENGWFDPTGYRVGAPSN